MQRTLQLYYQINHSRPCEGLNHPSKESYLLPIRFKFQMSKFACPVFHTRFITTVFSLDTVTPLPAQT
jgi:hypothetical protein